MTGGSETTTIDLLRHGEPEGGVLVRGWQDDPLSDLGWEQMDEALGDAVPWDLVVTSPLSRCRAFAETLCSRMACPMQVEERFKEVGFGLWEGRDPTELYQEVPELVAGFWADPERNPPPEGEPIGHFRARVEAAWDELFRTNSGRHLLVVAHGGVNRVIVSRVLGMPASHLFRMDIPYAGVSRIRIQDGLPRLLFHNGRL